MKYNITPSIKEKIGLNLYLKPNHPITIIKQKVLDYFGNEFTIFENLSPIVSIVNNFDNLLIPQNHPSRSKSDTYYISDTEVLRTHTSAHQTDLLKEGYEKFIVVGDVYRKDSVDKTHYPVFHQIEGVVLVDDNLSAETELKNKLTGLIKYLFPNCEYRLQDDYFPFTNPSYEIEVKYNDNWIEVLGCGVVQEVILNQCNIIKKGYAFGLGLERLAMVLFDIPDIRYFWSEDDRFLKQFNSSDICKFIPYSKYPFSVRDISFWIDDNFNENEFMTFIREEGGDLIESTDLIDSFTNPINNKSSKCYRITYRSNDRTLTNEEINEIQDKIRNICVSELKIILR